MPPTPIINPQFINTTAAAYQSKKISFTVKEIQVRVNIIPNEKSVGRGKTAQKHHHHHQQGKKKKIA
jgi:hypothetical protein